MTRRFLLLVAALALIATACGGSGNDESSGVASLEGGSNSINDSAAGSEATGEDVDPEEAMLALTQCLRDQGIDIADPTVDADGNPQLSRPNFGEGGPDEGFREAVQACEGLIEGVTLGGQRPDLTEIQDELLEFASCMRDNGYDMEDPDLSAFGQPGQGGQGRGIFGAIDPDDPAFESALESCEGILAGFGPGGGGGLDGGGRPGGGQNG